MKRLLLSALLALSVFGSVGQASEADFDNGIEGHVEYVDNRWVFVADQVYLIADYTRLEDGDGNRLTVRDLEAGRLSVMLSSTRADLGNTPIVKRLIVGPPI
jgi:hypothetical protein